MESEEKAEDRRESKQLLKMEQPIEKLRKLARPKPNKQLSEIKSVMERLKGVIADYKDSTDVKFNQIDHEIKCMKENHNSELKMFQSMTRQETVDISWGVCKDMVNNQAKEINEALSQSIIMKFFGLMLVRSKSLNIREIK